MAESVWPFWPRSSLHAEHRAQTDGQGEAHRFTWSEGFLSQATHSKEELAEEVWFPSSRCCGVKLSTLGCDFATAIADSHPILQHHAFFFLLFVKTCRMDLLWGEIKEKKNAALCLKQIRVSYLAYQSCS